MMSGMSWIVLALVTAFCFGAYNIFIKLSAGHIHEIAGAVILQAVAVVSGLSAWLFLRWRNEPLDISGPGIRMAILAGIFVGAAEILSFYVLSTDVAASRAVPVIIGGSVVASVLLGMAFLGERLRGAEYLGVVLIVAGIALLSFSGR